LETCEFSGTGGRNGVYPRPAPCEGLGPGNIGAGCKSRMGSSRTRYFSYARGGFDKGGLFDKVKRLAVDVFPDDADLKKLTKVEVEFVDPTNPGKK
jgi:hypothetical protein